MHAFQQFTQQLSVGIGKLVSWLIFAMMLISCTIVILRYGFSIGITALQESLLYLHSMAFLLGAASTLYYDEHVRVDIFYRHFNHEQKAWVNATGTLFFLLPFCLFLIYFGWQFFYAAWVFREGSAEPGGLPFVYLLKGIIPLAFILLLLQALSSFFSAASTLIFKQE